MDTRLPEDAQILLLPIITAPGGPILSAPAPGAVDGAVAELTQHEDGTITAQIRIPAPC